MYIRTRSLLSFPVRGDDDDVLELRAGRKFYRLADDHE
jgi:hypothetical protein